MTFPDGWTIVNQRQAVGAISPEEDALVVLTLAKGDDPAEAARAFFEPENVQPGGRWRDSFYNFNATASDGSLLRGVVGFVKHRDVVFQLIAYAGEDDFSQYGNAVRRSLASFGELRDRRFLDVQPARVEIVELPRAMSFSEFTQTLPLERQGGRGGHHQRRRRGPDPREGPTHETDRRRGTPDEIGLPSDDLGADAYPGSRVHFCGQWK